MANKRRQSLQRKQPGEPYHPERDGWEISNSGGGRRPADLSRFPVEYRRWVQYEPTDPRHRDTRIPRNN